MDTQGIVLRLTILTIYTVTLSQQANYLMKVEECPSSGTEWKERTLELECKDNKTYHCLPHVQPDKTAKKEFYAGCILFLYIMPTSTGSCPQVRELSGDFAFENEKFMCTYGPDSCPPMDVNYRSDELYKYPGCLGKNKTYVETTTHSTIIKSQSASLAWIAGIVVPVVILGFIIGIVVYKLRKKGRQRSYKDEKSNPANDVDNAAHLESLVNPTSSGSNLQQDEESNHTNGNAVHLEPLDNPTGQGSNSQQGYSENIDEADAVDGDDVQTDTPQPTETPAGQQPTVHITINHNYNITDNSKNNTTNIENAGNVLQGKKGTFNNISSENADTS